MALVMGDLVRRDWAEFFGDLPIWASRIHIQETDRNGFEVFLPAPERKAASDKRNERVMVHA
jgi:hypothetical protein